MNDTNHPSRATSPARLAAKRVGAQAGLAGAILLTIALSVALLCGLLAVTAVAVRASLDTAIPAADTAGGWAQVQTRPAADAEGQDAAASALFSSLFGGTADIERIVVGDQGSDSERIAWRITPDRAQLDGAAVLRLEQGLADLPDAFRASAAAVQGSEASGTLDASIGAAAQGVRASSAIAPVPVAIAAILAWFAVLELGRLLGAARGREAGLLRARGLSGPQSAVLSAAEAAVIAIAGGAIGLTATIGLVAVRPGSIAAGSEGIAAAPEGVEAAVATWPVAVVAAVVLGITLAVAQSRAARIASSARSGAGRVARAASAGAAVLVVLGASVLVWQSVSLRALPSDDPSRVVISALAPTFGVAAVGILAVLLFAPLATAIARATRRAPGLSPAYPARQVGRRIVAFSVAVALVAIAASAATIAGAYGATWASASTDSARMAAGASLRAEFGTSAVLPSDVADATGVPGVTGAAPAITAPIVAGEVAGSLVALPPDRIGAVMSSVPGAPSPAELAQALGAEPAGAALPDGATGLQLTGLSTPQAWRSVDYGNDDPDPEAGGDLTARGWVADAAGAVALVPFTVAAAAEGAGRRITATGELPAGAAPWRLLGVELSRGRDWQNADEQLRIEQLRMDAVTQGAATDLDLPMADIALTGWGLGLPATAVVWSAAGAEPSPVPAVVTSAFADALGLTVGGSSGIRFDGTGRSVTIRVVAVVDAIPGVGARPGALTPLDALSASALVVGASPDQPAEAALANEIWAAGPTASAAALSDVLAVPVTTPTDAAAAVTGGLVTTWWACAIGGAILAGVALIALLSALTGQRAGEVLVLRALGVAPRRQARLRAVEASVVVVAAATLGLVGGLVLSGLVVPGLAEAAVPGAEVQAALAVDPVPILVALAVIAGALLVANIVGGRAVRRQGAQTRLAEAAP